MKLLFNFVASMYLLCCLTGCSEKSPDKNDVSKISKTLKADSPAPLLHQIDAVNDKCRGGSGDSKETWDACDKRDRLMAEAETAGFCWGPQDVSGAEKHWIRCSDDPAYKKKWYSQDLNHANCIESGSPADRMRMIMESGSTPRTIDRPNGTVEVEVSTGNGNSRYWTYFTSMENCLASLPRSKTIDKKYE